MGQSMTTQTHLISQMLPMQTKYRLRASLSSEYVYGKYKARNTQLKLDRDGIVKPITHNYDLVQYGKINEKNAVAKFIILEKKVPDFILQDQDENRFVQEDYFTCSKGSVDLSAIPDGVLPGGLLEVKCPDLGRSCFEKGFPEQYICQIVMQQMVVNNQDNGYDIDHTYFMGWTPWKYKLWVYERNLEFEQYVDDALKEYAEALVNGGEVRKKPKDYKKVLADAISKIKLIKKGE